MIDNINQVHNENPLAGVQRGCVILEAWGSE
jgi:hypothetical protein